MASFRSLVEKVKLDSFLLSLMLVPTSHALDPEPQSPEGGAPWEEMAETWSSI